MAPLRELPRDGRGCSVSYLTIGGQGCIRGRVLLPRIGAWVADVVANPPALAPGAHVALSVGGVSLRGTVRRAQNAWGTVAARVVGGNGGLVTKLTPKAYRTVALRQPLADILSDCREQLSGTADPALLSRQLASWVRSAIPGWMALAGLLDGAAWRVLPDGTIWTGSESWVLSGMRAASVLSYQPAELKMLVYSDTPAVLPGQTFAGMHVSAVTHIVDEGKVRTEMLFEDPALEKTA